MDISKINFEIISENKEVVNLLRQKMEIDNHINELDEFALVLLEMQILDLDIKFSTALNELTTDKIGNNPTKKRF